MTDTLIQCEYAGHDEDGDPEYCEDEADVVVRVEGNVNARKRCVCSDHRDYLLSDEVPIAWEQCSESPENLVDSGLNSETEGDSNSK